MLVMIYSGYALVYKSHLVEKGLLLRILLIDRPLDQVNYPSLTGFCDGKFSPVGVVYDPNFEQSLDAHSICLFCRSFNYNVGKISE